MQKILSRIRKIYRFRNCTTNFGMCRLPLLLFVVLRQLRNAPSATNYSHWIRARREVVQRCRRRNKNNQFRKNAMNNIYSSWIWISQLGAECAHSSVCVWCCVDRARAIFQFCIIVACDNDEDDNYHNRVRASTYLRKFFRFIKWNENRYNDSSKATKKKTFYSA